MATNKYDAFVVDLASLEEANTALSDAHQLIWDTGRSDGSLSMCVGDAPALRAALQELDGNWALHRTKMLEEIQQVQKKVWGLIDDIKTVDDQGRGGPAQGVTAEGQSPRPRATGDAGAPSPAPTAPTGSPSGERHVEPDPGGAPVTGTGPSGGQAPVLDPGAEAADREGLREELEEARRRAEEEARIAQERVDDANRSILEKMLSSDAGIALLKRWATEAQNLMSVSLEGAVG